MGATAGHDNRRPCTAGHCDESPARRPLGLHAALRPRPRGGARARRRRGRAADQPLPLRPGAAGRRLPGRRALLPPQRRAAASTPRPAVAFKAAEHLADMLRLRRDARRRRRPLPVADRARPRRPPAAAAAPAGDDRPLHPAAAAEPPPGRAPPAASSARMDAVVAHSEHGAAPPARRGRARPGRVRVIPHGAFDYLTRLPEEKPLPAELEGAEGPVILFFGLLRPYKGIDTLLEAFRRGRGRRALDRRQPAHGRRAAARGSPPRRRAASASSPASSRTPRSRRSSAAPTSSSSPTATPSTPASSTPASPSASRWCSARSAASPRSPRTGAARLVPPERPGGARRGARASWSPTSRSAAPSSAAAAAARRRRPLLLGRGRPPHPRPLPRAARGARDDHRRRDPLLGSAPA